MKPEIALKIDYNPRRYNPWLDVREYTLEEVNACRNKWIAEYKCIAKKHPHLEELCEMLIDRIHRATDLFISREVNPVRSIGNTQDDSYYEWLEELEKAENDTLNGDFPLGNDEDAGFIVPHFTIADLALIQCGLHRFVSAPTNFYPETDSSIRKGIIAELDGDWKEAERCYHSVSFSKEVLRREHECRRKKIRHGDALYAEAQKHMGSGEWSKVPALLQSALESENTDAMTDMGLAYIYGTFGVAVCFEVGIKLLRKAAGEGNSRACMEIVELYDNGVGVIETNEAKHCCECAADAGDKKAALRLTDGFCCEGQ